MDNWSKNNRFIEGITIGVVIAMFLFSSYVPTLWSFVLSFVLALLVASLWVQKYLKQSFTQSFKFLLFNSLSWESLAVLIFLFFLLVIPRLNKYRSSTISVSGLADSMKPSEFNELILSDRVVFRVFSQSGEWLAREFDQLYWRSKTLDRIRGFDWLDQASTSRSEQEERITQENVRESFEKAKALNSFVRRYEIILESSLYSRQALTLDERSKLESAPQSLKSFWTEQGELWFLKYDLKRIPYEMSSVKDVAWDLVDSKPSEMIFDVEKYVQEHKLFRFKKWLNTNFSFAMSSQEVVEIFKKLIAEGDFKYSLSLKQSSPTVEAFLLDHREGLCEHYASSLAIVLKSLGHKARTVIGYQGGRWNRFGNFLEVQEKDAHAWVEYWESTTHEWVRVDPTAWVANIELRKSMIAKNLSDRKSTKDSWREELDGLFQVMGARFNQAVDYPWIKDFVQNLFDYSDSLRRNRGQYLNFLGIGFSILAIILFFKFRPVQETHIRKFRKVEKNLVRKDKNLKKEDNESYIEWLNRCARTLPEEKKQFEKLGRELSYSAYHSVRSRSWFLRT